MSSIVLELADVERYRVYEIDCGLVRSKNGGGLLHGVGYYTRNAAPN
jgi:hypothetical protein